MTTLFVRIYVTKFAHVECFFLFWRLHNPLSQPSDYSSCWLEAIRCMGEWECIFLTGMYIYIYLEIELLFHITYPAKSDLAGDVQVSFMVDLGEF